jgi:hypothetical protein
MARSKKQEKTSVEGLKIIRPYMKKPANDRTIESSLFKNGHAFIPNTLRTFLPKVDARGAVRTGLDPDAIKVKAIFDPELRAQERERLETMKAYYESILGESLDPTSEFFKEIKERGYALEDGDNVFDLANPSQAITYYWLMETGMIANSIDEIDSGKLDSSIVKFYVHDDEVDAKVKFEKKRKTNEARVRLDQMSTIERSRVAKLLGLGVSFNTKSEDVYNILDDYLSKSSSQLGLDPIETFNKTASMSSELIEVKSFVIDLTRTNIIRIKGSIVMEGNQVWAKTVEEFELLLLDKANKEVYDAFKDKLKNKIVIDNI